MDFNKKFFPESEGQYSYPAKKSNESFKAFRRYEFLYFAKKMCRIILGLTKFLNLALSDLANLS